MDSEKGAHYPQFSRGPQVAAKLRELRDESRVTPEGSRRTPAVILHPSAFILPTTLALSQQGSLSRRPVLHQRAALADRALRGFRIHEHEPGVAPGDVELDEVELVRAGIHLQSRGAGGAAADYARAGLHVDAKERSRQRRADHAVVHVQGRVVHLRAAEIGAEDVDAGKAGVSDELLRLGVALRRRLRRGRAAAQGQEQCYEPPPCAHQLPFKSAVRLTAARPGVAATVIAPKSASWPEMRCVPGAPSSPVIEVSEGRLVGRQQY